jgi:peptidoglycan/LPS O-acetylase OafA/YrhL
MPFGRLHGFRGVNLFFVLSGFLITTLALREESKRGDFSLRAFMIRRVFRIMPLFYMALVMFLIWASVLGMQPNGNLLQHYLPAFLFYCPEFPILSSGFSIPFGQSWSLGIEEKFYLLWPILAFVWLARDQHRVMLGVVLFGATFALTMRPGPFAQMWGSYADILMGCLLALTMHNRRAYDYLRVLGRNEASLAVLALLGAALISQLTRTQPGERLFSLACALTIVAVLTNQGVIARFFAHPWLARIGIWSYAIYLTHPIVFDVWDRVLPPGRNWDFLTLPLTLAVDLPICWLIHIYIEQPLINFGRSLAERARARGEALGEPLRSGGE